MVFWEGERKQGASIPVNVTIEHQRDGVNTCERCQDRVSESTEG